MRGKKMQVLGSERSKQEWKPAIPCIEASAGQREDP